MTFSQTMLILTIISFVIFVVLFASIGILEYKKPRIFVLAGLTILIFLCFICSLVAYTKPLEHRFSKSEYTIEYEITTRGGVSDTTYVLIKTEQ